MIGCVDHGSKVFFEDRLVVPKHANMSGVPFGLLRESLLLGFGLSKQSSFLTSISHSPKQYQKTKMVSLVGHYELRRRIGVLKRLGGR